MLFLPLLFLVIHLYFLLCGYLPSNLYVQYCVHNYPFEPGGLNLAEWLERLTAIASVATVLGSIPATADGGRQMKQC